MTNAPPPEESGPAAVPSAPADAGPSVPPGPSASSASVASSATSAPEPRRWWRRLRRVSQLTPSDPDRELAVPAPGGSSSLLYRSPFQIGFFITLGGLVAFGLTGAIVALQGILVLVLLSLFLAVGLNPLVEALHRAGSPRGLAVAIVALSLVIVIALGAWAVLPLLTEQVNNLVQNFPAYLQGLNENAQFAELNRRFNIVNNVTQVLASGAWIEGMFGGLLGAGVAIANVVFSVVVTLVLTLWFLASLPGIKATIYQLAPASRRPRVRYLAGEMFGRVGGYMSGVFLVVLFASSAAFLFLNLIGLGSLSLALSVIVAAFAFIPLVGPTISMLIVSLVAFSTNTTTGVITLAFFIIYQQVDAYLIQPRIFQRSVNVPGPLVVLAALSGGILFGIGGALIAIPTVASLLLLYREVLVPALDRS